MIRLSASAAFSISPPAFSIMPSSVSILAFSSGYSFSLSSKVTLLGTELFSISEKRSAMGSPRDGFTHIDLNNSEGFVQPKPSGRICKGTPVQPPFSLRCTELTRTFNCTPAKETGYKRLIHHRHFSCVVDFFFSE